MRNPFEIIRSRYITEKATMLESLKDSESNPSSKRCKKPKYLFIVDPKASKTEIAHAVETIYAKQEVKVTKVNTIKVKAKPGRQRRGKAGFAPSFKKAIVTMQEGDSIESA